MITMEDCTEEHLGDDLFQADDQSALTPSERDMVALRLRAIAMQLDRGEWAIAADGFRDIVTTLINDARVERDIYADPRNVPLSALGLSARSRTVLTASGIETLHDLQVVGDAYLLGAPNIRGAITQEARAAQRRWSATREERVRLAQRKLRNTKFAKMHKTP